MLCLYEKGFPAVLCDLVGFTSNGSLMNSFDTDLEEMVERSELSD